MKQKCWLGDELEPYLCCENIEEAGCPFVMEKEEFRSKVSGAQARIFFNAQIYTSYKQAVSAIMKKCQYPPIYIFSTLSVILLFSLFYSKAH